jgi:hypothetical protein
VKSLILVSGLFLLNGGRRKKEKKKKKKSAMGKRVSPGVDPACWLCSGLQLLGAIKG